MQHIRKARQAWPKCRQGVGSVFASLLITGTGILHGLTSQCDVGMAELYMMFEKKDTVLSERTRHSLGLVLLNQ